MLIDADLSILMVVDVQARLLPAMADPAAVLRRVTLLMTAARRLGVPIIVTEHCADRIGASVAEVAALAAPGETLPKVHFAAAAEPAIAARVAAYRPRRQAVLCGIETHVCVLQTALGLKARGLDVFLAADAAGTRRALDAELGLRRLGGAGVTCVSSEMVVFEWLRRADAPEFRELLGLIK
jgi:nicotinamidase-related amidase